MDRFRLEVMRDKCVVRDLHTRIICTFEKHNYDETLKIQYIPLDDSRLALDVLQEMRSWLWENHREVLINQSNEKEMML